MHTRNAYRNVNKCVSKTHTRHTERAVKTMNNTPPFFQRQHCHCIPLSSASFLLDLTAQTEVVIPAALVQLWQPVLYVISKLQIPPHRHILHLYARAQLRQMQ